MDKRAKDDLQEILGAYDARVVDGQKREAKLKADRASFAELFRSVKTERISPLLKDFATELNEHGHMANVLDQDEPSHQNGSFLPASIALRITPRPMVKGEAAAPVAHGPIEVKFSANQNEMKVLVSSSHNPQGGSGKRGEHELAELTDEFVVSSVLRTIREAFDAGR